MSEEINFDIRVDDLLQETCTNDLGSSSLEFVQQDEFDMEMLFDEFEMPSDVDPPQNKALETEINGPSNHKEFVELSSNDVQSFIAEQENKNTQKKTLRDVMKFKRFLENKNQYKEIHEIDPDQLDEYLANFCLSVRKPDGSDYEPSSLRNIVSSIDRKLKRHKYPSKIFGDNTNTFQLTRDALQAMLKSLKRSGKGNKPNKSSPITDYEINILHEKGILGGSSGKSLLNTLWFNNCVMFGLRGTKENYNLRWGDVRLSKASDGSEYLELTERQTKTRNGQNTSDIREVKPKIFALTEDPSRCPVEMYKLYASKRPTDYCEPQHPFYIAPRTNSQSHNNVWFNKMIVGEKKIGSLLKVMAKDGGLDENKRLTNHSTRKHLVQKLRDSGIAPTDIMQISGHKNIQSVMNYSSMSEEKHKKCSNLLSNTRLSSSAIAETVTTESQEKYKNEQTFPPSNVKSDLADTTKRNPESFHPPTAPALITDQGQVTLHHTHTLNSHMNALFSGATLNIQHFNIYMN